LTSLARISKVSPIDQNFPHSIRNIWSIKRFSGEYLEAQAKKPIFGFVQNGVTLEGKQAALLSDVQA
jgi:hypothetical protein